MNGFHLFDQTKLPSEWQFDMLGNRCTIRRGASPRPIGDPKYFEHGTIPWIKISDATKTESRFIKSTKKYVNDEGAKHSVKLPAESLIIANSGVSLGFAAITKIEGCIHDGWLSLTDFKNLDRNYVYYCINFITHKLRQMADGTTQPNLNTDIARRLILPMPPIIEQQAITHILGMLDDKIELNQQINKTLDEISHALFQNWFVDFEFLTEECKPYKSSGGKMVYNEKLGKDIPKGWESGEFHQIIQLMMGLSPKGESYNFIEDGIPLLNGAADFSDSIIIPKKFTTKPTRICKKGDLLFCIRGTIGNLTYSDKEYCLGRGTAAITAKNEIYKEFVYFILNKELKELISKATGSVIVGLSKSDILDLKIILPTKNVVEMFHMNLKNLFIKKELIKSENSNLIQIRDSLLPKLLSGKIRVPMEAK